ncbi:Uncharacterised protein [Vibrio cholerae]|uniref:Uncharacterized protein n=1 Tax=Vibrio cholerae TaxID=666 RepID=A0A655QET5_VIBCL|nr:Uncharacterised protein [Vibrio cholerae]CSC81070.1 Uncharacterised protein [Vibrio cholerae]
MVLMVAQGQIITVFAMRRITDCQHAIEVLLIFTLIDDASNHRALVHTCRSIKIMQK